MATWFHNPLILFEGSGPGHSFGARLKELKYPRLWYQTRTTGAKSEHPGLFLNDDSKRNLLTNYGSAITTRSLNNPDRAALKECHMYQWTETGSIQHVEAAGGADPSGAKKNHGDRAMADAMMWMLMSKVERRESREIVAANTMAALHRERDRELRNQDTWSRDKGERWCRVR
jgi:hypothetical protein